jgi:hypothetical protein
MPRYGANVSNAINQWIFAKKQPAAARNGYLIVKIRLLEVLPTRWRYCDHTAVRRSGQDADDTPRFVAGAGGDSLGAARLWGVAPENPLLQFENHIRLS